MLADKPVIPSESHQARKRRPNWVVPPARRMPRRTPRRPLRLRRTLSSTFGLPYHAWPIGPAWLRIVTNTLASGQQPKSPFSQRLRAKVAYFSPFHLHSGDFISNSIEGNHANPFHAHDKNSGGSVSRAGTVCLWLRCRPKPLRPAQNHSSCRRTEVEPCRHRRRQAEGPRRNQRLGRESSGHQKYLDQRRTHA